MCDIMLLRDEHGGVSIYSGGARRGCVSKMFNEHVMLQEALGDVVHVLFKGFYPFSRRAAMFTLISYV